LTDPKCYTSISKEKFAEIFKSDSEYEIPMLEERYDVLREAGNKLLKVIRIYKFFLYVSCLCIRGYQFYLFL
jgi:hypothetical protein